MGNLSGSKIKGYELQERIGVGGFGEVYRATQTAVGREVAIKVILPTLANQAEFVRRFETEAQLVARLEHLHITPLYDYWRDPEGAYLVMRMLRGGNLREAIDSGSIDMEKSVQIVDQISSALVTAHRNMVIHHDIKPSNILLDEDGNAYLTDFGIAQDLNKVDLETTDPSALIGSPAYLSPEQARSAQVTPQTDIYSLGIVLYEMLTGEHPFPEVNVMQVMFKHMEEDVPKIDSLSPDIGEKVNVVVQKATAKDPAKRYEDVHAFAAAFREAVGLNISQIAENIVELLTPREQEVLKLIIKGKSNREISEALTIELTTVKWYVTQIYRKLNVRSRVQAIARAREMNLIVDGKDSVRSTTGITGLPEPDNPYKGLMAFRSADEQNFYGREKLIEKLLRKMDSNGKHPRFMAVVGPSGSGKSSLVSAGLIPALWRGELDGSQNWYIVEMIPGEKPLDELEVALTRIATDKSINLNEQLKRDAGGLMRAAKMILPNDGSELLLVVDQFEELFTLVEDEEVRAHFLDLICSAVNDKRSRVRVVVTLRADFYDRPLQYPEFGKLIHQQVETVLPLSVDELERAIVKPAHSSGVSFEDGLVPTIIKDIHYQPGALPLLQYALTELFEKREGRNLTHAAYQQMGGVVGALARQAEEVYDELNEEGQEAVRQMFLRLVTMGEGVEDTRRRVSRAELLEIAKDPDLTDEIIDTYAAYRLLSLDNDLGSRTPTVEVAHEAILREWGQLRKWLNESRTDIRLQRQLARAAREWRKAKEDTSFLLHGARLEQFEGWRRGTELALTRTEKEYLKASITLRDKELIEEEGRQAREKALEKRSQNVLRWLVGVFAAAALVSLYFMNFAFDQQAVAESEADARSIAQAQAIDERDRAVDAEEEARTSEEKALVAEQSALKQAAILLSSQAETEVEAGYYDRAVLLALEALANYPYVPQAESALAQAVTYNRVLLLMSDHKGAVLGVAWSPDGSRLASAGGQDNTVQIFDASNGEQQLVLQLPETTGRKFEMALSVTWSPDGQQLLTVSGDRFLIGSQDYVMILWDATTGEQIQSFSPSNTAGSESGYIAGDESSLVKFSTGNAAAFSSQSGHLATIAGDDTAIIWNSSLNEAAITLQGHENDVNGVAWSFDEKRIATASEDGTARIWDTAAGELLFILRGHEGGVNTVAWSPDGQRLVTAGDDGTARIWDAETGEMLTLIQADEVTVWVAAWSPDGARIVTGNQDTSVRIWDAETGAELIALNGHRNWITHLAWSPQGDRIATASFDGEIRIWNAAPSTALMTFPQFAPFSSVFSWSPAGNQIVVPFAKFLDSSGNFIAVPDSGELAIIDAQTGSTHVLTSGWVGWDQATYSPDGNYILGRGQMFDPETFFDHEDEQTIFIFDVATSEIVQELYSPDAELFLRDADWSADGSQVLAADTQGQAYIWDVATGELVRQFTANDGWVVAVAWSPDGTKYVTGGFSALVKLWDAVTGELIFELDAAEPPAGVTSLAWSPDGKRLLSVCGNADVGALDNAARIWDATTGELLLEIDAHTDTVAWGGWSPDGSRIVTTSFDNTTRIWDATTGAELLSLDTPAVWGTYAAWSPNGTQLFTAGTATTTPPSMWRVWQTTEELIDYANACCIFRELTTEELEMFGLPTAEEQLVMP